MQEERFFREEKQSPGHISVSKFTFLHIIIIIIIIIIMIIIIIIIFYITIS